MRDSLTCVRVPLLKILPSTLQEEESLPRVAGERGPSWWVGCEEVCKFERDPQNLVKKSKFHFLRCPTPPPPPPEVLCSIRYIASSLMTRQLSWSRDDRGHNGQRRTAKICSFFLLFARHAAGHPQLRPHHQDIGDLPPTTPSSSVK